MQFSQLAVVKHRVVVGAPLPFNVRNADQTLLLARGQVIHSHGQLEALFERGCLVDVAELLTPSDIIKQAPAAALPGLWRDSLNQVGDTLRHCADEGFADALTSATPAVLSLIERDKDLAIFQVLRADGNALTEYGVNHSTHTAITAFLVAQRLGWTDSDAQRLFKVALTMNLSMLELQGQLAIQTTPLNDAQRAAIRAHPQGSVAMLEASGVTDADWLRAVAQHHEKGDGSGYPLGCSDVSDLASLVQRADIYTAKLSPRHGRSSMAADKAGRAMFMQDPGNPMTAALVKEFGVYPPGCFVRLASSETGVVVKRGPTVTTPMVAVVTSAGGNALKDPIKRDTSRKEHAIAAVVPDGQRLHRISPEKMMELAIA